MPREFLICALALVALGCMSPAWGQGRRGGMMGRPRPEPPRLKPRAVKDLDELARMTPAEREQHLRKLSPDRRKQLEQRLERYRSMKPEQRERLQHRLEAFQSLPPERRQLLRDEFQHLRTLSAEDRRARLDSDEIRKKFSPDERRLLGEVAGPARAREP